MDSAAADCPETITEQIAMPDTSGLAAAVSDWQPVGTEDYLTRKDYFDMLRLKIESNKQYPETARKRQIEGRVDAGFTITEDGDVVSMEVVRSSRHPALDRAALNAIEKSAPFPHPPANLFQGTA